MSIVVYTHVDIWIHVWLYMHLHATLAGISNLSFESRPAFLILCMRITLTSTFHVNRMDNIKKYLCPIMLSHFLHDAINMELSSVLFKDLFFTAITALTSTFIPFAAIIPRDRRYIYIRVYISVYIHELCEFICACDI